MRPAARRLATLSLSLSLSLGLGACGEPAPPSSPAPLASAPLASASASASTVAIAPAPPEPTPAARFAVARDRALDDLLRDQPQIGRTAGLHAYDGVIGDMTAAGFAARAERLQATSTALAAFDRAALSPDDGLDLDLVRSAVAIARFRLVDLDEPRTKPLAYEEIFSVNAYLDRDYEPIVERAKRLLAHEKAAIAAVPNLRKNLVSPMSKPVVETAAKVYRGYAEYLRGDVVRLLRGVGDAAFQADLAITNEALAKEADRVAEWLAKEEAPKGDASHVLGEARFRRLVAVQEGIDLPLAEFERMGEADLQANKRAYEALARTARATRPKASELLATATELVEASRRFLVDKGLVTLPSDERAHLKETPPYMRWNAAFLDAPGPFEKPSLSTFYYLTMPDPSWPKKEQDEYLMPRGVLLSTTVHEVYPGHFLQGQWIRRAPTRAQKLLDSYSFVEGWAHYGEQLMIEQGFGAGDPQNRLGQLSDALLRDCRFVVAVGVHARGMSLAEAERRFEKDCHQDKATAREQATRATFDPGYFAYTLGKVQILALRDEAKRRLGPRFSLQRFHDALLSHGSPPVPLVRERVLAELDPAR